MARGRNQFVLDPHAQLGIYLHNLGPVPTFIPSGAPALYLASAANRLCVSRTHSSIRRRFLPKSQ